MHFPVQAESTALLKSVGDKMQADYLTVAIKEPCELLRLLQGSLVKPLVAEPRLMLSKGLTTKCKYVPEESSTQLQICHFPTRLTDWRRLCVIFFVILYLCLVMFFPFITLSFTRSLPGQLHLLHRLTWSSNHIAAHKSFCLFKRDILYCFSQSSCH